MGANLATAVLASGAQEPFNAPGVDSFFLPDLFVLFAGTPFAIAINKVTLLVALSVVLISGFYLWAYRKPQIVPSRKQWVAESSYGFIREGVAKEVIGPEGVRFAPYFAALFMFILVNNLYGIIPMAQLSPNSHIAFPTVLAVLTFLLYHSIGIRKHGFFKYWKDALFPAGVPWVMYPLLTPIELATHLIIRPLTLAVRLFANMFAGHLLLGLFALAGVFMLNADSLFLKGVSPVAFLFAIILTFFEVIIAGLQAYVFVVLTASYISGALAEEH